MLLFGFFPINLSAYGANNNYLPEGAILRIGKGILGEIAYFPDGTHFAVATSIGVHIYDSITAKEIEGLIDASSGAIGINSISFTPNGKMIATESSDGKVLFWDVTTRKFIKFLSDDEKRLHSIIFSANGKTFATLSSDKTQPPNEYLRFWDSSTNRKLDYFNDNLKNRNVCFSPNGFIAATWSSHSTVLRLLEVKSGMVLNTFKAHDTSVDTVCFSPDGKIIASGSSDDTVRLWETSTGELLRTLVGHKGKVISLSFSNDGKTISCLGLSDGILHLWDVRAGQQLKYKIQHNDGKISSVCFSANGKIIATGGTIGVINLWSSTSSRHLIKLTGHKGAVNKILFSPDGITLLSKDTHNTVCLWNAITGQKLKHISGYTASIQNISFLQNGDSIASWSSDETLRLWDTDIGDLSKQYELKGSRWSNWTLRFSPTGRTCIAENEEGLLCLWNVESGQRLNILSRGRDNIEGIFYSSNGNTIVSRNSDWTVHLLNPDTGQLIKTINEPNNKIYYVINSTDRTKLLTRHDENVIQIWDSSTGNRLHTVHGINGGMELAFFSPQTCTIWTSISEENDDGVGDFDVFIYDGNTGKPIKDPPMTLPDLNVVCPSPDGKIIAVLSDYNDKIHIFDMVHRKLLNTFSINRSLPHSGRQSTSAIHFAPDGQTIVTTSGIDGTAISWSIQTGKRVQTFSGHTGRISSVKFSPDGKTLATASSDGTILLWKIQ